MIKQCQPELPTLTVDGLVKRYRNERSRRRWTPIYQELIEESERLSEPAAVCHEFAVDDLSELHEWLPAQTTSVVLAICTLGARLDDHMAELTQKDLVAAVILGEISLAAINGMTRAMHASIRNETLSRGLKAGAAYRPGVGRWPLQTQQVIFERIPAHDIGVTLDEFFMMRPVKSTSLIIPILDKNQPATDHLPIDR